MLIVTSLTQLGGRERVRRMSKQSNAHRCKLNSTLRKRKSHKNEETIECMVIVTSLTHPGEEKGSQEWRNDRMLIVASLTRPGGWERVTEMNKRSNAHRRKPNSTRRKRKGHRNEQSTCACCYKPNSSKKRECLKIDQERRYIITSLAQPAGKEKVINKQYSSIVTGLIYQPWWRKSKVIISGVTKE